MTDIVLDGRSAIVTGGAKGLGRAMTLGLARAGADVVVTGRDGAALEDVVAAANNDGCSGRLVAISADVTDETDCRRIVDRCVEALGGVDILVNNAGIGMRTISEAFLSEPLKFWQTDPARWRALIDTNVNGAFLMARAVTPHLIGRGWGRIVNISMNLATIFRGGFSPYGPSKAALESMTAIWAQDLGGTGVTVNALLPGGATQSGMIPDDIPQAVRDTMLAPEILVPPLLWLCSPDADSATGGRYDAKTWDLTIDASHAATANRQPAGWTAAG